MLCNDLSLTVLYLHKISTMWSLIISIICGVIAAIITQIFIVPMMRRKVNCVRDERVATEQKGEKVRDAEKQVGLDKINDTPFHSQVILTPADGCCTRQDTEKLFSSLQILTACFGSFQHGGNDVANAVGPVIALWVVFSTGSVYESMGKLSTIGILFIGGLGIALGLWLFGRRVIETVGTGLTKIRPSTGFTIEIGSACTVLLASKFGIPVSTTHCKIGSVVFVGYADGKNKVNDLAPGEKPVNWRLFGAIFASWVATLPAAMGCSAAIMYLLKWIFL